MIKKYWKYTPQKTRPTVNFNAVASKTYFSRIIDPKSGLSFKNKPSDTIELNAAHQHSKAWCNHNTDNCLQRVTPSHYTFPTTCPKSPKFSQRQLKVLLMLEKTCRGEEKTLIGLILTPLNQVRCFSKPTAMTIRNYLLSQIGEREVTIKVCATSKCWKFF